MTIATQSPEVDEDHFHDLIAEYLRRIDRGEAVDRAVFMAEHPELAPPLQAYFENEDAIDAMAHAPAVDCLTYPVVTRSVSEATTAGPPEPIEDHAAPQIPETFGRYRVLKALGHGAMGAVYLAQDQQLGRPVALKIPKFNKTDSPGKLERFYREARSAALLRHPNICPVFDVGEIDGQHYISMAFIEGRPLSDLIRAGQLPSETEVAGIVRKLALGLADAHAHGVIHRDLKPANIMIDSKGEPVVMDFGLAQSATQQDLKATKEGAIIGTVAYMSPEQASGDRTQIGPGADIYSLGVILYEMLTGRVPFTGDLMSVLKRIAVDEPEPPSQWRQLDSRLETICLQMLAKRSSDRYASMQDVAQSLDRYLKWIDQPRVEKPGVPGWPLKRPIEMRWLVAAVMAVAVVVLLAAVSLVLKVNGNRVVEKVGVEPPPFVDAKQSLEDQGDSDMQSAGGWHGWPKDAPPPAIAPFDAEQAKAHQEAWSAYLKVPVEYENSIGMKFRLIPPGEFLMGSTPDEFKKELESIPANQMRDRLYKESEVPQHCVILTHPVYLGLHEVTQAQYVLLMEQNPSAFCATGYRPDMAKNFINVDTSRFPVDSPSWESGALFWERLSRREHITPFYVCNNSTKTTSVTVAQGIGYRFPTEAEWEFACRAGTTTVYWPGNESSSLSQTDWLVDNSRAASKMYPCPHPVGELAPNPFGLFDLHGNVAEWCHDYWSPTYYSLFQEQPAIDPWGSDDTQADHIERGGNWYTPSFHSQSTLRRTHGKKFAAWSFHTGMRAAISVDGAREILKRQADRASRPPDETRFDRDRAAAEWVLEIKGTVSIRTASGTRLIKTRAELPDEPFAISQIDLGFNNQLIFNLEKLARLGSLEELKIQGRDSSIRDDMLAVLPELPSLRRLFFYNAPITDLGMISRCRDLEHLEISSTLVADAGLREIHNLSKLKDLKMSKLLVTNDGLDPLAECRELERISFQNSLVTVAGLRKLRGLPKLRELKLCNCRRVADAEMEELRHFLLLEGLSLFHTGVGDAGIHSLTSLPAITNLDMTGTHITDVGLQSLATFPRLSTLSLVRTKITDAGLQKLANNSNLLILYLGDNAQISDAGMIHVARMPNLRTLDLTGTPVSADGLKQLESLKSLKEIRLTNTKVTAEGVAAFKKALPGCKIDFSPATPASSR